MKALGYQPAEVFPIKVGKYRVPYTSVLVNGQKVEMVFDTANMTGLSISPQWAQQLKLRHTGFSPSLDTDGSVIGTYRVFEAEEVVAFGEVWKNQRVYELGSNDLDGLFGPRFLRGKRFTLDYRNLMVAISKSPLPAALPGQDLLPLVLAKRYEGMIVVRGLVQGREVLIQVDTGKSRTCVDRELATALRLPKTENGYRMDEIRLGSLSFAVPSAREESFKGISEGLPGPILLGIGSDILSQVVLTVDYAGQRLAISK